MVHPLFVRKIVRSRIQKLVYFYFLLKNAQFMYAFSW